MLEMISSINPFVLLAVGVVIVFIFMFVFVKPDKKKTKKEETKADKKQEVTKQEKTEDKTKDSTEVKKDSDENSESVTEKVDKTKKQVKKSKIKPDISYVYQKTEKKEVVEDKPSDDGISDELLSRAQFVNDSKTVSKFVGFKNNSLQDESNSDVMYDHGLMSEELSNELADNCDDCKRIIKHFDRSRRLSKIIKEDSFDQMFMDHLTDHYMKFDVDRHLKGIDQRIYEKASEMLSNSTAKVLVEDEKSDIPVEKIKNDKDFMRSWLESRKKQEQENLVSELKEDFEDVVINKNIMSDLRLNAKNLVVAEVVMNRKSLRHNKK